MLEPRDAQDLCAIVAEAAAHGQRLNVCGGGTRAETGAPHDARTVSLRALSGVIDYDPAELVLTVRAGTPLDEIEALVAGAGQMLAFEPHGAPGSTIGGVVAAGIAGSRRVSAGGARDHLLGLVAVSGRGETCVAGAKVVKNVTGYDLPKLYAGSWGRLGPMTELTLKVLPRPRESVTMVAHGLSPRAAHGLMAAALGSTANVCSAAHLARGLTLLRVAGFGPSVAARCALLPGLLRDHGALETIDPTLAPALWTEAMTGCALVGAVRWRVHLPPRHAPELIARLHPLGIDWAMDWGGGLVWIALDERGTAVRQHAAALGGEAMLVAADPEMRAAVPALHPRAAGVAALEARVRRAFDPAGVFASGRFAEDAHADPISA
jgi:glycolate oxidase FAD binding subunit